MPLPPRGSPQRPLAQAVNAARVLGTLLLAIVALIVVTSLTMARGVGSWWMVATVMLVYCTPAVAFLVFGAFMKRGHKWAVITTLVLASLACALWLLGLIRSVIGVIYTGGSYGIGPLVFGLCLLCAGGLLIFYCAQALRRWALLVEQPQGFTPIMNPPPVAAPDLKT